MALGLVVVQNTAHVLMMRHTRMKAQEPYLASSAVLCMETTKLITCIFVVAYQEAQPLRLLYDKVVAEWSTTLRVAVPAILYVVQNNVLFIAATELDAPVFQVLYQLKILTTALFTILILGRTINMVQWGALFLLACGVAVVQLSTSAGPTAPVDATAAADSFTSVDMSSNSTKGLMAVAAACASLC